MFMILFQIYFNCQKIANSWKNGFAWSTKIVPLCSIKKNIFI